MMKKTPKKNGNPLDRIIIRSILDYCVGTLRCNLRQASIMKESRVPVQIMAQMKSNEFYNLAEFLNSINFTRNQVDRLANGAWPSDSFLHHFQSVWVVGSLLKFGAFAKYLTKLH